MLITRLLGRLSYALAVVVIKLSRAEHSRSRVSHERNLANGGRGEKGKRGIERFPVLLGIPPGALPRLLHVAPLALSNAMPSTLITRHSPSSPEAHNLITPP